MFLNKFLVTVSCSELPAFEHHKLMYLQTLCWLQGERSLPIGLLVLNLLSKWGKREKIRCLPSILWIFRNKFNKFNNTGARMLDSIYHMTLNDLKITFWCEKGEILPSFMQR